MIPPKCPQCKSGKVMVTHRYFSEADRKGIQFYDCQSCGYSESFSDGPKKTRWLP